MSKEIDTDLILKSKAGDHGYLEDDEIAVDALGYPEDEKDIIQMLEDAGCDSSREYINNWPKNTHPLKRTSNFWQNYERNVKPWHFATVKSHFSGKKEEFQDFRNPEIIEKSGPEAPFLKIHAKAVQDKILSDKDIHKKMIGGKPHIWLWRGVSGKYAQNVRRAAGYKEETHSIADKKLRVPVAPLSSWSTKLNSAKSFASRDIMGHPRVGAIIGAYVPVEDVLHSGFHSVHPSQEHEHEEEYEIVVGHKKPHMAIDTKNMLTVNHATLDSPPAIHGEKDEDYVERMLSSSSEVHHKAVFNNPGLSKRIKSKHLEGMLKSPHQHMRSYALANPNLSQEHIEGVLNKSKSNTAYDLSALSGNPSLNIKQLQKLSDQIDKYGDVGGATYKLFSHPNANEDLLLRRVEGPFLLPSQGAIKEMLYNNHKNLTPKVLSRIYEKAPHFPGLAIHSNLPRNIIDQMVLDLKNHLALSVNPSLGKEHVNAIIEASKKLKDLSFAKIESLTKNHYDKFSSQNISDIIKAGRLSDNAFDRLFASPNFSSKHVDQILSSDNIESKEACKNLIKYPNLSSDHLHELIKKQWVPGISKHPNFTSDHVTTALKSNDPAMRLEGISSPKATNAHVALALKDPDSHVRMEAQKKAKGMIESFGNKKRAIEAALKRKQTNFFAKTELLSKLLKLKDNLAKGTSDWETQMREHEKSFRASAHTGDWPTAIEHAKRLPKSWDVFQQMPSMGIPEEHAHKVLSYLERPENEELRPSFAFEMAHNMPETASHKLLSRTANLSPDDYSVAGAVQKHPNWKPETEEKGSFDAANFFTDYEKHVQGHHFATIKAMYSGKTEEIKDHRGNVSSSKEHEHLIPHIKAHAEKVQRKLMEDPFTQKKWINGEAHVKLYRGVGGEYADKIRAAVKHNPEDNSVLPRKLTIPTASFSSWSTKKEVAGRFAHVRNDVTGETKKNGVVMERWVPLKNVLHAGFINAVPGQEHPHSHEEEVVVGHPEEKISIHSGKLHFQLPSHEYGQTEQAEVRDPAPKQVK